MSKHYVNNKDFLKAMVSYKEACAKAKELNKPEPAIPNYIGECFLKIAEHLSRKPNFIGYSFREEMIADGIENCLMYFRNFDETISSNPFAYFTQTIFYAFLRRIQLEKEELYAKYKSIENSGLLDGQGMYADENGHVKQFEMYDNISEFIRSFEETKRNKLKKKIAKTRGVEKFIEKSPETT